MMSTPKEMIDFFHKNVWKMCDMFILNSDRADFELSLAYVAILKTHFRER